MSHKILAAILALTSLLAACAGDAPKKEDSKSVREAICSGGGGGGGDPCTGGTDGCPAECSYCFRSVQERVQLQNMWECDPGGGGGGGGGPPLCSSYNTTFTRTAGMTVGLGYDPFDLCPAATAAASSACEASSGILCVASVGSESFVEAGCDTLDPQTKTRWCYCTRSADCNYSSRI